MFLPPLYCKDSACVGVSNSTQRRAHEVSTSKQHKSISASDVFKALELIEFADLIPSLQAELQGTLINMPSSSSTAMLRIAYPLPNVIFFPTQSTASWLRARRVRPSGARLPAHPQPGAKAAQAPNAGRERSAWLQRTRSACRLLCPVHLGRCLSSHNRACRWMLLRRLQLLTRKRTLWLRGMTSKARAMTRIRQSPRPSLKLTR
jgi:hypothetical protein